MKKKLVIILSLVGVLVAIFLCLNYLGIGVGNPCGYYHFAAPYTEDCKCIGIKTGGCSSAAFSCDEAMTRCLGIRNGCYRTYHQNKSVETVACRS